MTFPNSDNLPRFALVYIYSLSERGGFERVGIGRVTSDQRSIELVTGGIRATTWHFTMSPTPNFHSATVVNGGPNGRNNSISDGCEHLGSSVCPVTGTLSEEHYLPSFKDSGLVVQHSLGYMNSPSLMKPVVTSRFEFEQMTNFEQVTIRTPAIFPRLVSLSLQFNGVQTPRTYFKSETSGLALFKPFALWRRLDIRGVETGIYPVRSKMEIINGTTTRPSSQMRIDSVDIPLISAETEFGMGWRLQELQRLHGLSGTLRHDSARVMLVHGNFRYLIFVRKDDGSYESPKGDYSTLQAIGAPFGGFIRTTKEGTSFVFDSRGFLLGRTNRYGRKTTYSYTDDKLTRITHHNGDSTSLSYGADDGLIETITDPHGRATRFEHDGNKNLIRITDPDGTSKSFSYSPGHALMAQTDQLGNSTNYAYNERGSVNATVRADHSVVRIRSGQEILSGMNSGVQDSPHTVDFIKSGASVLVDARGNEQSFRTNQFGSIMKIVASNGLITTVQRDENNNLTHISMYGTPRPFHFYTRSHWYDSYGNVTAIEGTGYGLRRSYEYRSNPADNFHRPVAVVAANQQNLYEYDDFGNIVMIKDPENNITQFTYNSYGQVSSVRRDRDLTGKLYQYDSNGGLEKVIDLAHKELAGFTYDAKGNITSYTDAKGNVTNYTYDSMNRMLTQIDAKGGVMTFTYNAKGKVTSLQDPNGGITRYTYDALDRMASRANPLGRIDYFTYDGNGNIASRTDGNGNTTTFEYDVVNRLVARHYPDGTSANYSYDIRDNLLRAENSSSKAVFTYDDLTDRLLTESTEPSASQPYSSITYEYRPYTNNLAAIRDSEMGHSRRILYEYDGNDRLAKIKHLKIPTFGGANGIEFSYDPAERRSRVEYPNGVVSSFTYSPGKYQHLRKLSHRKGTTELSSFTYSHDLKDYVTSLDTVRSEITVNSTVNYSYDVSGQLVSAGKAQGTGSETFTYDSRGNRLRGTGDTSDSTFNAYNQVINDKVYRYVYDNNGNRTKRTHIASGKVIEYSWDYENRLVQIIERSSAEAKASKTISYKYDALGRKVEIDVNGKVTRYVYSGHQILLEYDGNNMFQARYVYGNSIDHPVKMERERSPYKDSTFQRQEFYYHRDRIGNVTEITNFAGEVVQRYVYDSFGKFKIYDDEGNEITSASTKYLKNPFTFVSREYEPDSGLYDFRGRRYDPESGAFISADPIWLAGGDANFYRYVLNNPINFTDPYGLDVYSISLGGLFAISGLGDDKANSADIGLAFDTTSKSFSFFSSRGRKVAVKGGFLGIGLTGTYLNGGFEDFFGQSTETGFNTGQIPFPPHVLEGVIGGNIIQTDSGKKGVSIDFGGAGIGITYTRRRVTTCPIRSLRDLFNFIGSLPRNKFR